MLYNAFSWLGAATPVWLSLCLIAACGGLAWQLYRTVKRIDRHAQSIGNMDEWADMVDQSLREMQDRGRRYAPPPPPPPPAAPAASAAATPAAQRALADLKSRWQK